MKIHKKLLIALLGLHTLQAQPVSIPIFAKAKQLISYIARSPEQLLHAMGKHKIISTIAMATTALLAIPRTRHALIDPIQKLATRMFLRLALKFHSPFFIKMGSFCGANYNIATDPDAKKPLHIAAQEGQQEIIHSLIRQGAHVDALDNYRETPLHTAAGYGHEAVAQELIAAHANINAQDSTRRTPLLVAVSRNHPGIIANLVAAGANTEIPDHSGKTPLHQATFLNNANNIRTLVQAGANINATYYYETFNWSPLHIASSFNFLDAAKELIAAHANLEIQGIHEYTALHMAIDRGNIEIAQELIKSGANPNAQTPLGATPLCFATMTRRNLAIVKALVQSGASTDIRNACGETTLKFITHHNISPETIEYLNNIPQLTTNLQEAAERHDLPAIQILATQGAPMINPDGTTLFDRVIGDYNPENPTEQDNVARALIRYTPGNIAVAIRNRDGQTPLHIAAQRGNLWVAEYLLRHGAQVNARDNTGNTSLHYAASPAMLDKLLLKHHADASLVNHAGETPIATNINVWGSFLRLAEQVPQ